MQLSACSSQNLNICAVTFVTLVPVLGPDPRVQLKHVGTTLLFVTIVRSGKAAILIAGIAFMLIGTRVMHTFSRNS